MELLLTSMLGLGLAAAAGFRVFVPLLGASVAARAGHLQLAAGFTWLEDPLTTVVLAVATVLEVGAFMIPWLDNALDTLATPAAVIAGTLATSSVLADVSPWLQWTVAVIAGGGAAGTVQATTVIARGTSSVTTAGLANPLLAFGELVAAVATTAIAVIAPILAVVLLAGVVVVLRRRGRRRSQVGPEAALT